MKKILVVDDEEKITSFLKTYLEETLKYQVHVAHSGESAYKEANSFHPDLILLDIIMPNMDGNQLIETLKGNPDTEKILIVVTSGLGEMVYHEKKDRWKWEPNRKVVKDRGQIIREKDAQRASEAYGVDDFLAKPFSPDTLKIVISEVFEKFEKNQRPPNEA